MQEELAPLLTLTARLPFFSSCTSLAVCQGSRDSKFWLLASARGCKRCSAAGRAETTQAPNAIDAIVIWWWSSARGGLLDRPGHWLDCRAPHSAALGSHDVVNFVLFVAFTTSIERKGDRRRSAASQSTTSSLCDGGFGTFEC